MKIHSKKIAKTVGVAHREIIKWIHDCPVLNLEESIYRNNALVLRRCYYIEKAEARYIYPHLNAYQIKALEERFKVLEGKQTLKMEKSMRKAIKHLPEADKPVTALTLARNLGIGRNKMLKFLRNEGILLDNNLPKTKFIHSKHLVIFANKVCNSGFPIKSTRYTAKGCAAVVDLLYKRGYRKENAGKFNI